MKNITKRIIAILLIASFVIALCPEGVSVFASSKYLFEERFSGNTTDKWQSTSVGTITDGKYSIAGSGINMVATAVTETNYAVQSEVLLKKQSGAENSTASIIIGADAEAKEYYEFGIGVAGRTTYAFLYKQGESEETTQTIYQLTSGVPGAEDGRVLQNTTYELTAVLAEGQLICLINGEEFKVCQRAEVNGHYTGVKSTSANAVYDNFVIAKAGEKTVDNITVINPPEQVTVNGVGLVFDIQVKYSGWYGVTTISSDTDGVQIKGFDGTTGKKTFTVSYKGASTNFTAEVVADETEKVLFQEDFSSGLNTDVWAINGKSKANGDGVNYTVSSSDGKAIVKFPTDIGSYTNSVKAEAKVKNASLGNVNAMENYSIETDAVIVSNSTVEGARAADAGIDIATSEGALYSFRVRANGSFILYHYTTVVAQSSTNSFQLGQTFRMKVEAYDGMILCYYNDECVLVYQSDKVTVAKRTPYIGLCAVNGTVKFDNFVVKEIASKSIWAATSITVDDLLNNSQNINRIKAHSFDTSRYLVKLHYPDGTTMPVLLEMSMLSGYSASNKKSQTVTLTCGAVSKTLYYDYSSYIFYEGFEKGQSSMWVDSTDTYIGYMTTTFNKALKVICANDSNTHELSRHINQFSEYPDVKVSAEVSLDQTDNLKTRRVGVRARYNEDNGYCYEFLLSYEAQYKNMYAILYRRAQGGLVQLGRYGAGTLAELIGEEDILFGKQYSMSIECVGNQIYLYFEGKLLDVIFDTDEKALLSGACAGYRVVNTSTTISNFRVEEANERSIRDVSLSGVDGTLKLYQGFEILPYDHDVNISFSDGLTCSIELNSGMIGAYDNTTPGKRTVPISCLGQTLNLPIEIVERPEYLAEFESKVKKCPSVKKISLDDKSYIDEMKEMYDSLSGYEIRLLDEKIVDAYQEAVDTLYRLEYPELAQYDTVYVNDFNGSVGEPDWNSFSEGSTGTWTTTNSMLINEQLRYGFDNGISYFAYTPFYGEVNSVEADVMLTNIENCYVSLLTCINDLGYYHARIKYTASAQEGDQFHLELYKFLSNHQKLGEVNISAKGIDMEIGEWYNMRLVSIDGKLAVYLNDKLMMEYDDSTSPDRFTTGTFGFRSLYGDMRYDSLRVMGTESDEGKYVPQIEKTYYKDDFEDETVGKDPSHWLEETDSDLWKVYKKDGRLVYGTKSKAYGYTWLHTFESDPKLSMDFMVENASGRIEFLTRYAQETYCYAGIGYDFAVSKWYVYTNRGMDFEPQIVWAEEKTSLKAGVWHKITIEEDGVNIKVLLDDKLVIEDTNAYMTGFGRVGCLSENANLYIDNFSYEMPNGGSVNDGVVENLFDYENYGSVSSLEIESLGGDTLIGVEGGTRYLSTDDGKTWSTKITDQYQEVMGKGYYCSFLELSAGVHLMVYGDDFSVYKSSDNMKTWTKLGYIAEDLIENKDAYGNTLALNHVNTLTKLTLADGSERIFFAITIRRIDERALVSGHYTRVFYTDDGGKNWSESANDTRDVTPNYTDDTGTYMSWAEAKFTIDAEGVIRMYNSRQYDCMVYTESHDGGVTWEGFYSVPYLQNGQTSHSIVEDPENPGTWYMVCLNTKTGSYNSTLPRNRLTLVKSTDGKTWEYVMDIERFTSCGSYLYSELYQMIDPSISIIEGYMHITFGRSYAYEDSAHMKQALRLVRLDMDKLPETREWNDATLADSTRAKTIEIDTMPQVIFGLGDIYNTYGGVVKATAFNGNVKYQDLSTFTLASAEPNMYKKGNYTVSYMNMYGQMVSYDIEVTDNYNITWNVQGEGEITPYYVKIAKGLERTFEAIPEDGWKLESVLVNGKEIALSKNEFSIIGTEDITIDVVFVEKTTGYLWIMVFSLIVILGTGAVVYIAKRRKARLELGGKNVCEN